MPTSSSSPSSNAGPAAGGLPSRNTTYLIAKNDRIDALSAGPLEFDWLVDQIQADPAIEVQKVLAPRDFTLMNVGESVVRRVVVATMPDEKARDLEKHPQVVLEEDHLVLPVPAPAPVPSEPIVGPAHFSPFGTSHEWHIQLRSPDGTPIAGATVYLYGSGVPAQGRSDDNGDVTLSLLNESDATLRSLYVNPQSGYWSLWVDRPDLVSGAVNTVTLEPLARTFPGFPERQLLGWGQMAMGLDELPAGFDGRRVKVAVIDSGAASTTHRDLRTVLRGIDVTVTPADEQTWTVDTIAHGSHCSGIIAGSDNGAGIRGFAPAVEMHEARIFPGGRVSSLLDALDYCINEQIDVVNMSLGTAGTSQIVLQKLAQAREQGVACIVAAGNSGGAVQFPGVSPDVLTVSAIGHGGEFPDSSYHARQRWRDGTEDGGFFAAQFSCHGPEIDVCGPGVAIVSSVPDDAFAAWDGTSMATPHVAGLAALVLGHHPEFQTPAMRLRTRARVDRLFEIIKESAQPFDFGDRERVGAGMPTVVRAFEGSASPSDVVGSKPTIPTAAAVEASLAQLREEFVAAGLLPPIAPMAAAPAATVETPPETMPSARAAATAVPPARDEQRRTLCALKAQMAAAGLDRGNLGAVAGRR